MVDKAGLGIVSPNHMVGKKSERVLRAKAERRSVTIFWRKIPAC